MPQQETLHNISVLCSCEQGGGNGAMSKQWLTYSGSIIKRVKIYQVFKFFYGILGHGMVVAYVVANYAYVSKYMCKIQGSSRASPA